MSPLITWTRALTPAEPPQEMRSRFVFCGRVKNRVITIKCTLCQNFVCNEHATTMVKRQTCTKTLHQEETEDAC